MVDRIRNYMLWLTDMTGTGWCGYDERMRPTPERPYEVIKEEYKWLV